MEDNVSEAFWGILYYALGLSLPFVCLTLWERVLDNVSCRIAFAGGSRKKKN